MEYLKKHFIKSTHKERQLRNFELPSPFIKILLSNTDIPTIIPVFPIT